MKSWKTPTPEEVDRAVAQLAHPEARRYFFERLENPLWIEPLRARGYFRSPPAVLDHGDGTVSFPAWEETRFLARMATHEPRLVREVMTDIASTDNPRVWLDFLDAALVMPPEEASWLLEYVPTWLKAPYRILLPDRIGQLIVHLLEGAFCTQAVALTRQVMELEPDPRQSEKQALGGVGRAAISPTSSIGEWEYEELLRVITEPLVRTCGNQAIALLADLLEKGLVLSRKSEETHHKEDYSFIWRPAIEDHDQNLDHGILEALVVSLRNASEFHIRSHPSELDNVVSLFEDREWTLFKRLAIHLLKVGGEAAKMRAAKKLVDVSVLEDGTLRHEVVALMKTLFPVLDRESQIRILGWIAAGPDVEDFAKRFEGFEGRPPTADEIQAYRDRWQRDRLNWLGVVPEEWMQRYEQLLDAYGEPEHPDFVSYRSVGWVGPESPKTSDELRLMSVEEVAAFLQRWVPSEERWSASIEGLGRRITEIAAERASEFAERADLFLGLDPTYIRALFSGLREALKAGRVYSWEPVLSLGVWVTERSDDEYSIGGPDLDRDPHWGWCKRELASLLEDGFAESERGIPSDLRSLSWSALEPLTRHLEPSPEYEHRFGGRNMDPATLSINTVRGEALHAVIRYALWIHRAAEARNEEIGSFSDMPEVEAVLSSHLDESVEASIAVRAVYGQWLPWLILLDEGWVRNNLERIFPPGDEKVTYRLSAWTAYVVFCRPFDNAFRVLESEYRAAIDRIGYALPWRAIGSSREPDERLGEHLTVIYWRGLIDLSEGGLLKTFFEGADDSLRGSVLGHVGFTLYHTQGDVPREFIVRLMELWEWRFAVGKSDPSAAKKELASFGWWVGSKKFPEEWFLRSLLDLLEIASDLDLDHAVVEALTSISEPFRAQALRCMLLLLDNVSHTWTFTREDSGLPRFLAEALSGEDQEVAELARKLINALGERGDHSLRPLLSN